MSWPVPTREKTHATTRRSPTTSSIHQQLHMAVPPEAEVVHRMTEKENMKTCSTCRESKSLDEFYKRNASDDGRAYNCKTCTRGYNAASRERRAAWYKANRDRQLEYSAKRRATKPHTEWEKGYRRRSKMCGQEPLVESFTRDELIARYGSNCWHCGGQFEQLDHYPVPIVRGGEHSLENCRPSCAECNRKSWRPNV